MNKDLTVGKPGTVLWKFCLPLFASMIFQQLYNIADSFTVGKFVGENALAAVGNSYELTLIFIACAIGCNIGCSVIASRLYGAKRYKDLKTSVYTSLISSGIVCAVIMTAGLVFSPTLLSLINTPASIFDDSKLYLDIYLFGLPFMFFYNISTGIFSALGDSKTPFFFLMSSSLANIGMDILFTTALSPVFPRGVDGVAWATFICQGISCILAVTFVLKRLSGIKTEEKPALFSFALFKETAHVAIPSILQQSFISVGNILIQSIINIFGTGVIAGYSAAIKLNNLFTTSFTTLSNGISNYTAQNIGAQKLPRVHEGFKAGLKLALLICLPIALLYFFAGKYLLGIFLDAQTGTAMETGMLFLRITSPLYFVVAAKLVADGILRGSEMMNKFIVTTFTDLILRVILAKILSSTPLGSAGIWLAWPLGWIVSTTMSLLFYKTAKQLK